jgi:hypothetical protein
VDLGKLVFHCRSRHLAVVAHPCPDDPFHTCWSVVVQSAASLAVVVVVVAVDVVIGVV